MWRKGMLRAHVFGGGNVFSERFPHPSSIIHAGDQMFFLGVPAHPQITVRNYLVGRWEDGSGVPNDFWDLTPRTICGRVDGFIIDHPHPDHGLGGIELAAYDIFYNQWRRNPEHFSGGKGKLPLLLGEYNVIDEIARSLLKRIDTSEVYPGKELGLDDYFHVPDLDVGDRYQSGEVSITILEADHCTPAAGIRIDYDGKTIIHTSDTRYLPHVLEANLDAQVIFADCAEIIPGGHSTSEQYEEFVTIHPKARPKLWLYHVPDNKVKEVRCKGFNVITDPVYLDITKKGAIQR